MADENLEKYQEGFKEWSKITIKKYSLVYFSLLFSDIDAERHLAIRMLEAYGGKSISDLIDYHKKAEIWPIFEDMYELHYEKIDRDVQFAKGVDQQLAWLIKMKALGMTYDEIVAESKVKGSRKLLDQKRKCKR